MNGGLFDLDFSRWEIILLSLFPSVINIFIFIYVSVKLPQNKTNFAFASFVLLGALWQIGDGFVRLSVLESTAIEWYRVEMAFSLFVVPYGVLFTISSTGWYKKISNGMVLLLQFLPSVVCLILILTRQDQHNLIASEHWFWVVKPEPVLTNFIIYGWLILNALMMLALLWLGYLKSTKAQKHQSLLLAIGFTLPLVGGIIAEAVFPLLFNLDYIPILTPLITTFTIAAFLSLKNNFLDYSPRHQWDQIVETMNEGILIVNSDGYIMYANKMFCETLEYEFEEIKGYVAYELFLESTPQKLFVQKVLKDRVLDKSSQYELQLISKTGKKIWFIINGTPYKKRNGKIIGSIDMLTNIDSKKRADDRFKALVENVTDLISLSDKDGNVIYDSPAIEKITGYTSEEMKGHQIYELIHPEHIEESKNILEYVLKNPGLPVPRINRFRHKDGHYVWVEGVVTNLLNNENVKAIVSSYHDVTERRESEQKLKQKEERLSTILDNEPECVKVVDLNGILLEMNPAGLKVLEARSINEVVGKSVVSLIHKDDIGAYFELHNRVCKGETGTVDFRVVGLHNTERMMESNSVPLKNANGEIYAVLSVARDITEIKKKNDELIGIKNKLEYSESRLKQAQAIAHVGSWEFNLTRKVAIWSDEVCRIFGLPTYANTLSLKQWLMYIHPEDINYVVSELRKSRISSTNSSIQHRIIRTDGEVRFVNSESRYDRDIFGKAIGMYGVVHDVTEVRLAELHLKRLLDVTNDQNNRLQNFAYIISHNIRSHSANIIGIIDIYEVQKEQKEKDNLFKMLKTSTNKLTETIENLNDIITIQNSTEMQRIELFLRSEVDKTIHAINSIISNANTQITNLIPENLIVNFVPSYLESILLNLITNAIKYKSPDRDPEIQLSVEKIGAYIVLSVSDNGLGIDLKKNKDKLFGMYKTFHTNKDARGFGLYITKNQIEAMGGKIEVESELGKGSTFKIYINEQN
ncbi:MAG: PAS domain S-box protein [bacterium]|nr:PAS domain S-box protein [bacterium]